MELFIAGTIGLLVLYVLLTAVFNRCRLHVKNYLGKWVPYSIGSVFFVLLTADYFFFATFVTDFSSYLYLSVVWVLGLIDDIFGQPFPKGIKGHLSLFYHKREVSTGLLKAAGVVVAATIFLFFHSGEDNVNGSLLLLLILFPHTMNLLDTKPLRVLKAAVLLIFIPLLALTTNAIVFLYLFLVLVLWGVAESTMKAMLGDNGAMLAGAFGAVAAFEIKSGVFTLAALIFAVFVTWYAEKSSVQTWLENTPLIRKIDQFGRTE
ncbi:hypothetical protein SAMN05421736_102299 [Evansella caseinilytica]|uniref:UDP-N-acetylmuramyl pentapeptide phosphotransferase/UDP-N-acetylglucosamine-1-phosphate transferase n=1 Tax=Evansella caseinilytica TaxID=1503961 RepID=A0A1H3KYP1_9BACI|nr:hypothetical protein [Evansella caseinilytica]SDY57109.1 hypothetical protein SAMN05421736_102299 [Evansella caseinilytica]